MRQFSGCAYRDNKSVLTLRPDDLKLSIGFYLDYAGWFDFLELILVEIYDIIHMPGYLRGYFFEDQR